MPLHLKTGDGDLPLIKEPALLTRCACISHEIYRPALVSINNRGRGLGLCDITQPRIDGWVDFYHYRVVVYTHCLFQFKQHVKVILHPMTPLMLDNSLFILHTSAVHYGSDTATRADHSHSSMFVFIPAMPHNVSEAS